MTSSRLFTTALASARSSAGCELVTTKYFIPARRAPAERRALGSLETATGWLENETNTDTEAGEHIDKRVGAEQVYAAAKQVAHSRLADP